MWLSLVPPFEATATGLPGTYQTVRGELSFLAARTQFVPYAAFLLATAAACTISAYFSPIMIEGALVLSASA
jgi:hypothetical protein